MDIKEFAKPIEDIGDSAKDYVNAKIDQFKLRLTKELACFFNILFAWLLIILAITMVVVFLVIAFGQWLGDVLGSPVYGSLISAGCFLLITVGFILFKRQLFINRLVRTFIKIFFDDENEQQL